MLSKIYKIILITIIIISLSLLFFESVGILTGKVTQTTPSEITVNKFIAMGFSTELQAGIVFNDINFLPADNVDANKNYDVNNRTQYYVTVSNDSNSAMDLCIRADSNLENPALDIIGIANETYSHSLISNETNPSLLNETSLAFGYVLAGDNIPIGGQNNLRFWLDVPAGQAPGTYNNSIYFKGTTFGAGC